MFPIPTFSSSESLTTTPLPLLLLRLGLSLLLLSEKFLVGVVAVVLRFGLGPTEGGVLNPGVNEVARNRWVWAVGGVDVFVFFCWGAWENWKEAKQK